MLVEASGEAAASDVAEGASDEGAGATSDAIEVDAGASDMTEVGAVSAEAGMSEDAGATEVSTCEVAASGVADDSAPAATSVGVAEAAGDSVTTALDASAISSADDNKSVGDLPSEVGTGDSIVAEAGDSEAEGASKPGS